MQFEMKLVYIHFQKHISVALLKDCVILMEDAGPHLLARNPFLGQVTQPGSGKQCDHFEHLRMHAVVITPYIQATPIHKNFIQYPMPPVC